MTIIAEGFNCESRIEIARFFGISRRSAIEVQSLPVAALDITTITEEIFQKSMYKSTRQKHRSADSKNPSNLDLDTGTL